jgi:hypothetical protein
MVTYSECRCGERRSKAHHIARITPAKPGWPDPFAVRRREAKRSRRHQGVY